jgi:hypothetical protein
MRLNTGAPVAPRDPAATRPIIVSGTGQIW